MQVSALQIPNEQESRQAHDALEALRAVAAKKSPPVFKVRPRQGRREVQVDIPAQAFTILMEVLGQIANGNAVTIVPVHAELTTQQAADILNVSRPYVVGLLDDGKLACRKVGTHRRIRAEDLFAYIRQDDLERKGVADELTAEAQDLGLGY